MTKLIQLLKDEELRRESRGRHRNEGWEIEAGKGLLDKIREVMEEEGGDFDVNERDEFADFALIHASHLGLIEVVKFLVNNADDIEIDMEDKYGHTALMIASVKGKTEIAKFLLDAGAKFDVVSCDGHTALTLAACKGNTEIVYFLLERGAKLEEKGDGLTALMWASCRGYVAIVKVLLRKGANKDERGDCGKTSLMLARENGNTEVVEILESDFLFYFELISKVI